MASGVPSAPFVTSATIAGQTLFSTGSKSQALEETQIDYDDAHNLVMTTTTQKKSAGGNRASNIQPIFADLAGGGLAIAHNGNLTNAHTLRQDLVKRQMPRRIRALLVRSWRAVSSHSQHRRDQC